MKGDAKFFTIHSESGAIERLVEAKTEKEVRAYLLKDISIGKPTPLTVIRLIEGGMKAEKAGSGA